MMCERLITACLIVACSSIVTTASTLWHVGVTRAYTTPGAVSGLVRDGDTVEIDAGTYTSDVCQWKAHRLLLRCTSGKAVLASGGAVYGGKAIWVVTGDSTVIENIVFEDARCVDKNGAGIRLEGHHVVVRSCVFKDNENGILVGAIRPCTILIEHCEFAHNGFGDGYSHNLYIGAIDTLVFRYNYSHESNVGHELKSRADVNLILSNRLATESAGNGSRCIDLPNGGIAIIAGNDLQQGPSTSNSNMIGYGLEGLRNGIPHRLFIAHNTYVSTRHTALFNSFAEGTEQVGVWNNLVFGKGDMWSAATAVNVSNAGNIHRDDAGTDVNDGRGTDFGLTSNSVAIDSAEWTKVNIPDALLVPAWEYAHPAHRKPRCSDERMDVGAHELCATVNVQTEDRVRSTPVYADGFIHFPDMQQRVTLWTLSGSALGDYTDVRSIDVQMYPSGVILLQTADRIVMIVHCR